MTSLADSILKFQHRVDQRSNALGDELIEALTAVEDRLTEKLALAQALLGGPWEDSSARRRAVILTKQREDVRVVLAQVYQDQAPGLVLDAAADIAAAAGKTFGRPGGITKELVTLWAESTTVDGLLMPEWLAKIEATATDRITAVGRQAMIEGLPVDSMARLLRSEGIEASWPGLSNLSRTFCLSASNYARDETLEEVLGDAMDGWRHLATLDGRTCIICGRMDGSVYPKDKPRPSLPVHISCRCLYVPVTGIEGGERPVVKHEERTVHHRDGSTSTKFTVAEAERVPAETTYSAWLGRQLLEDPDFVRSILGKTRFELFSDGKLSLDRMATTTRIKKLSEL